MQRRGTTRMYFTVKGVCIAKTSFAHTVYSGVVSGKLMDGNKLFPTFLCKPATRKGFY